LLPSPAYPARLTCVVPREFPSVVQQKLPLTT
jgi:hypothetical protein